MKGWRLVGETTPKNIQKILNRYKKNQPWYVIPRLNGTVEVYIKKP